jgi:hypothetical protein
MLNAQSTTANNSRVLLKARLTTFGLQRSLPWILQSQAPFNDAGGSCEIRIETVEDCNSFADGTASPIFPQQQILPNVFAVLDLLPW